MDDDECELTCCSYWRPGGGGGGTGLSRSSSIGSIRVTNEGEIGEITHVSIYVMMLIISAALQTL